jgi:hypothetical protein
VRPGGRPAPSHTVARAHGLPELFLLKVPAARDGVARGGHVDLGLVADDPRAALVVPGLGALHGPGHLVEHGRQQPQGGNDFQCLFAEILARERQETGAGGRCLNRARGPGPPPARVRGLAGWAGALGFVGGSLSALALAVPVRNAA